MLEAQNRGSSSAPGICLRNSSTPPDSRDIHADLFKHAARHNRRRPPPPARSHGLRTNRLASNLHGGRLGYLRQQIFHILESLTDPIPKIFKP